MILKTKGKGKDLKRKEERRREERRRRGRGGRKEEERKRKEGWEIVGSRWGEGNITIFLELHL